MDGLFELLKWTLNRAKGVRIKFSPKKLQLVTKEIKWCGKLIVPGGVEIDPERKRVLETMPLPRRGDELMQFINAVGWMRTHLVEYSATMGKLQD